MAVVQSTKKSRFPKGTFEPFIFPLGAAAVFVLVIGVAAAGVKPVPKVHYNSWVQHVETQMKPCLTGTAAISADLATYESAPTKALAITIATRTDETKSACSSLWYLNGEPSSPNSLSNTYWTLQTWVNNDDTKVLGDVNGVVTSDGSIASIARYDAAVAAANYNAASIEKAAARAERRAKSSVELKLFGWAPISQ
jgi:hypothetical protein